jgi:hypothetical protein
MIPFSTIPWGTIGGLLSFGTAVANLLAKAPFLKKI